MIKKMIHTADLHFSVSADKLPEVVRTTDFLLEEAHREQPDVIVISGDSVDEYDGRIRLDSDCARAAISFIERAASIAPVVIIRGTKSHDRETPYLFGHLRGKNPIYVASSIEQVALVRCDIGLHAFRYEWRTFGAVNLADGERVEAVFTLVPSLDKAQLLGQVDASIAGGNLVFREVVHDLFAGFGLVNETIEVPTVLSTHGMLTGAVFSSGQTAVGEDLEFGLDDLRAAKCSYTALGHVHKFQAFPGHVVYSGSPGRLNFGEQEEKGFCVVSFNGRDVSEVRFVKTPARRFCFGDADWDGSAETILQAARTLALDCEGADVRFRFSIPADERLAVDRGALEAMFMEAGANRAKIEMQVLQQQRTRAAGISRKDNLTAKVEQWGETVGEKIPADVLALSDRIEGLSVEELILEAQAEVAGVL